MNLLLSLTTMRLLTDGIILRDPKGRPRQGQYGRATVPVGERSRVSCAECRITLQAMQFARDLADMMPGRDAVHYSTNQTRNASHDQNFARR